MKAPTILTQSFCGTHPQCMGIVQQVEMERFSCGLGWSNVPHQITVLMDFRASKFDNFLALRGCPFICTSTMQQLMRDKCQSGRYQSKSQIGHGKSYHSFIICVNKDLEIEQINEPKKGKKRKKSLRKIHRKPKIITKTQRP